MTDSISDITRPTETGTEDQKPSVKSVDVIPEDFVEDDALPSVFLEDLEGDKEVWLLECPLMVDPSKLMGKQLHFSHQTSFKTDENMKEKCIAVPTKEDGSVYCLLSSCSGQSVKAVELQHTGKIRLNLSYDVPDSGLMIPDGTSVPLPEGLKTRHPFLGSKYQEIVELMRNVNKKSMLENTSEGIQVELSRKRKKKRKSIGVNNQDKISSEEIDNLSDGYEKKFSVPENEVEYFSPKKAKKKKRENHHMDDTATSGEPQELEGTSEGVKKTLKKIKKEKNYISDGSEINLIDLSQGDYQEPKLEGDNTNNALDNTESIAGAEAGFLNRKKKKKRDSHYQTNYISADERQEEMVISNKIKKEKNQFSPYKDHSLNKHSEEVIDVYDNSDHTSKKLKKKKKRLSLLHSDNITTEGFQDELNISCGGSDQTPKKIKVKKRESRYQDNDISIEESQENLMVVYEGSGHISKKKKQKKCEIYAVEDCAPEEKIYASQEHMYEERKQAKKLKKRHTMDNADVLNSSMVPERLGLISEEETNVASSGSKKKKIRTFTANEVQLLSPKKEAKIKYEHLELDASKEKIKKERRKSRLPEM